MPQGARSVREQQEQGFSTRDDSGAEDGTLPSSIRTDLQYPGPAGGGFPSSQ